MACRQMSFGNFKVSHGLWSGHNGKSAECVFYIAVGIGLCQFHSIFACLRENYVNIGSLR